MTTLTLKPIEQIDGLTKEYAEVRQTLADRIDNLQRELAAVRRRLIKGIKAAAAEAGVRKSVLERAILEHPDLFVKPRTMTLHGIKVGLEKGKGKVECADESAVIARIEKMLPDQAETLIKVQKKLVKAGVKNLDVAMCRKLGLIVHETDDQVVIRAQGDDVDKLVAKILEEETED